VPLPIRLVDIGDWRAGPALGRGGPGRVSVAKAAHGHGDDCIHASGDQAEDDRLGKLRRVASICDEDERALLHRGVLDPAKQGEIEGVESAYQHCHGVGPQMTEARGELVCPRRQNDCPHAMPGLHQAVAFELGIGRADSVDVHA
jgi:hypothetical protein